jgi:hypothetical protein
MKRSRIPSNESFLFGPGPAFELAFASRGIRRRERPLAVHQKWLVMVRGVFASQTESMFSQTLLNIPGLANVEGPICRLQNVDPHAARDTRAPRDWWKAHQGSVTALSSRRKGREYPELGMSPSTRFACSGHSTQPSSSNGLP